MTKAEKNIMYYYKQLPIKFSEAVVGLTSALLQYGYEARQK